jgi:hypothetical protein
MSESSGSEKPTELVATAIDSDSELIAIRAVLGALVPLKRDGRARVLDYVFKRLGMPGEQPPHTSAISTASDSPLQTIQSLSQSSDIRSLTKEKSPGSANEMAALVAYYLAELAPEGLRKQAIGTEDIKTYFKQAQYKLPLSTQQTLVNAKNSGYLESIGNGQYRLNPVGYNLVVHNLPGAGYGKKKRPAKKSKVKKAPRKSSQ